MSIEKSPHGTYGAKMPGGKVLRAVFEPLAKRSIESYRKSGGTNRMSRMMGFPVVLLTTKGATSGIERIASLGGFADGDEAWLVVASNMGSAKHPAWFLNMVKHPDDIWLEVGRRKLKVRGESLTGAAREEAIKRIAAISARYGGYQQKTDRTIPVVRLTPADT
jgi:deazaflavin-dependent oxidoreductase (nitroreductase family)